MSELAEAERAHQEHPESRKALRKLYVLYARSGEVQRASELAELWSTKDPLDPGALTARADLAVRSGQRARAIRLLGSVVDVRPGDAKALRRLARLHRWQGRPGLGCRYSIALAEFRPDDAQALAEAVRCSRATQSPAGADLLLALAAEKVRKSAEELLSQPAPEAKLSGDLRLVARWDAEANVDVDLSLIHPDGHRVSWLGAPTRSMITATDVLSRQREGLALRGAKAGEYVVEVVRGDGSGPVRGTLVVAIGKDRREIPFELTGERTTLGVARVRLKTRLVSAW